MRVAFVTNSVENCGVHQFGAIVADAFMRHSRHSIRVFKVEGKDSYFEAVPEISRCDVAMYNYYPTLLPYLSREILEKIGKPCIGLLHEYDYLNVHFFASNVFHYRIAPDPSIASRSPGLWTVPRIVPRTPGLKKRERTGDAVIIGSMGFASPGKNFLEIIEFARRDFSSALVRLHISSAHYVDVDLNALLETCRAMSDGKIEVEVSTEFLSNEGLIEFLAANDINVFLYDDTRGRGLSSAIDMAIAAEKPIALSDSDMFRHLRFFAPECFLSNRPTRQMLETGGEVTLRLKSMWTPEAAARAYDRVFEAVVADAAKPRGVGYNAILDDNARTAFPNGEWDPIPRSCKPPAMSGWDRRHTYLYNAVTDNVLPDAPFLFVGKSGDPVYAALVQAGYAINAVGPGFNDAFQDFHAAYVGKRFYRVIASSGVMEEVEDDMTFISRIVDFLAPTGRAFLTLPFTENYIPGQPTPAGMARLYSPRRLLDHVVSRLHGCRLLDAPHWRFAEGERPADGGHSMCGFAFEKLCGPLDAVNRNYTVALRERHLRGIIERLGHLS